MKTLIRWATLALALAFAALAPTFAADCPDPDGDNYVVCSGCTAGSGDTCGDCDETDNDVHPGASEVCNGTDDDCNGTVDDITVPDPIDGVDNDTDGLIDEGFGPCIFHQEGPANECKTGGATLCVAGALKCVNPNGDAAIIHYADETIAAGNCEDGINNDCDSVPAASDGLDNDGDGTIDEAGEVKDLTDIKDPGCQQPEICDHKDNDGDGVVDNGFTFGPCSAGNGECARSGSYVCNNDGSGTHCSAIAGNPKNEGTQFGVSCDNSKDDDCDNLTDLSDPDCAGFGQDELCGNGVDDDGDGLIDEGFASLGLTYQKGVGACSKQGVYVCNGAGTDTECGATPGAPVDENSTAGDCADNIDNDCDGLTDAADPDCSGTYADLGAWCQLSYQNGQPGSDCGSKNFIKFGSTAGTVKAELMAFNTDGSLLAVLSNIHNGDEAHLLSRLSPTDWRWVTQLKGKGVFSHTVFAPMPLLRVTATGAGGNEDVAWCGIMPLLDVTDPDGVTLSLNEGSDVDVKAKIPLVNVDTLNIKMDGIDLLGDILGDLGLTKAGALPTGNTPLCTTPGACKVSVPAGCGDPGNVDVEIQNLKVEGADTAMAANIKAGIPLPNQVNTLSFTLHGLPPGGHVIYVTGSPLPITTNLASVCYLDDIKDTGTASAFGIRIDSPTNLQEIASAPVHVQGKVCGGNQISTLKLNGKGLDVTVPAHQTCSTVVDPTVDAPECVVNFNEPMAETDLNQAI
ncbi:MAG TPA: putative metal-binding motif-containing protein, partial [Dongiaceae bacterium]|nr:putative metal-binding motif-containing protein [Dongiaceae bacterium]